MTDQFVTSVGSHVELESDLFMIPTGAGALHAVTSPDDGLPERLLRLLLRRSVPVASDDPTLWEAIGLDDPALFPGIVADTQRAGWVEGRTRPLSIPDGPLGRELPALIEPLSDEGRAALVDDQGFSLSTIGFDPEAERELTVLAAEVARLQQRRTTDAVATSAVHGWGLLDHRGAPDLALYPFAVGDQQFILIVGGLPRLIQEAFTVLMSALSRRYAVVDSLATRDVDGPTDDP